MFCFLYSVKSTHDAGDIPRVNENISSESGGVCGPTGNVHVLRRELWERVGAWGAV